MEKLIEGCKGKQKARRELFRRYRSILLGVCLRYSRDKSEAEDILLEGFMQIYSKIGSFNGTGSFEGWMKKVMVHTAIDYFRKNRKESFHENIDEGCIYSCNSNTINISNMDKGYYLLKAIAGNKQFSGKFVKL